MHGSVSPILELILLTHNNNFEQFVVPMFYNWIFIDIHMTLLSLHFSWKLYIRYQRVSLWEVYSHQSIIFIFKKGGEEGNSKEDMFIFVNLIIRFYSTK